MPKIKFSYFEFFISLIILCSFNFGVTKVSASCTLVGDSDNCNGVVDTTDTRNIVDNIYAKNSLDGDSNGDNVTDLKDLVASIKNQGRKCWDAAKWPNAVLNPIPFNVTNTASNNSTFGSFGGKNAIVLNSPVPSENTKVELDMCGAKQGKIEIEFYDNGSSSKGLGIFLQTSDVSDTYGIALWPTMPSNYGLRANKGTVNTDSTLNTRIKRSTGWHTLEIYATPVGVFGILDGVNLSSINGRLTGSGFVYPLNQNAKFITEGISKIYIGNQWAGGADTNYISKISYSPIDAFPYTNTDVSISEAHYQMAKYFLNQYKNSRKKSYYTSMMDYCLANIHPEFCTQEFNHINSVAALLALIYKKEGGAANLNDSIELLDYSLTLGSNFNINQTPYSSISLLTAASLIWNDLPDVTKGRVLSSVRNTARYYMMENLNHKDPTIKSTINPWGVNGNNHIPYQREVSLTKNTNPTVINPAYLNAATRDNAWTSAFYMLASDFEPLKALYPQESTDYATMANTLAYHSIVTSSDGTWGSNPLVGNQVAPVVNTIDWQSPVVAAYPNPFYSFTTMQFLLKGLIKKSSLSSYQTSYLRNIPNYANKAASQVNFFGMRSLSSTEGVTYYPSKLTSFENLGRGHQSEDLTVQMATLTALSKYSIPNLDNNYYKNALMNALKFEFFTFQKRLKYPHNPFGTTSGGNVVSDSANDANGGVLFDADVSKYYGRVEDVNSGAAYTTLHTGFMINTVVMFENVMAYLMLNPSAISISNPSFSYDTNSIFDSVDATDGYFYNGVGVRYFYKGDKIYKYTCGISNDCTAVFKTILSSQYSTISVTDPAKWAVPLPTADINAAASYLIGNLLNIYIIKNDRVWNYKCDLSSSSCQTNYTDLLSNWWASYNANNIWSRPVPYSNIDSFNILYNPADDSLRSYITQGDHVWVYKCTNLSNASTRVCSAMYDQTLTQFFASYKDQDKIGLYLPTSKMNSFSQYIEPSGNYSSIATSDKYLWRFFGSGTNWVADNTFTIRGYIHKLNNFGVWY